MKLVESLPTQSALSHRAAFPDRLTHLFPYDVNRFSPGLFRAEEFMRQKPPYGLVVVFNHYSLRDFVDLARALTTSAVIRERPVLVPIAWHQYNAMTAKIEEYLDLALRPIVIRDTLKRKRFKHLPLGKGLPEYVGDAARVLKQGGVVPISVQEGRRSKLGAPEVPTLSFFLKKMERKETKRIAILFAGLSLPGETNYRRFGVNFLNPYRRTEVRFGEAYTLEEVYSEARRQKRTVDEWVYARLSPLVPAAYR